jgi:hypothetical protein
MRPQQLSIQLPLDPGKSFEAFPPVPHVERGSIACALFGAPSRDEIEGFFATRGKK